MRMIVCVSTCCAFLLLSGCKEEAPIVAQPRPVRTVVVEHKVMGQLVSLTGQIRAQNEVALAFRIDGRLLERLVSVGDLVQPGQLIGKLNSDNETNALRSAEADVEVARAALTKAQGTEGRQKELLSRGFTTRAQYDQALQQLQTTQANLDSAQARLRIAQDRLGYTELHADAAGAVTAKGAEPGEVVRAGQMIVQVARQDGRDAVFDVPAQLMRTAPRDPLVEVALSDDPSVKTTGRVREVAPQADPVTRTFQVKIGLTNPPAAMRLGATVTGHVSLNAEQVIALPGSALFDDNGKSAVWVVDPTAQTVSLRSIDVARYDPGLVIVSKGLQDGEIVVTAGVQILHPGQKVRLLDGQS